MATEVLQRAAIIQKAEEMRLSSVKLATVQGFDVAAVINLIVHASPKEALQALIDDPQKLETEMLRAYHTIKGLFPLLQDVEPDLIKQLSKESLTSILESIPHGVTNEASELAEINRCNEFIRQQSEAVSRAHEETRRALDSIEAVLEEAKTQRWNRYVKELQDLVPVMPPQALKKAQAGDIAEATAIINREISDIESKKVTIHQDPDSVALLQQDEAKLARLVEEVERTWREVSSYEERIVNASVAEISGRLRSNVNDQVRHELSAALDAADQSVADVDALLSERAAFDAALEAATQRTIESLCSDVALRTQAMLQSQEHESPQLGVADVFAVDRAEWCSKLDQGLAAVTQLVEQDLLDKHQQFIEAYEQARQSQVVQGEFARLEAEMEGIRAATLKALQERPAQYTETLSSRVKELQAKADEILGTMHDHMVESMINTSKAKAEQYVRECRANLRAATPRHANWSLVEELAGVEDDKLVDKARELLARAQQRSLAVELEPEQPEAEPKPEPKPEIKPETASKLPQTPPTGDTGNPSTDPPPAPLPPPPTPSSPPPPAPAVSAAPLVSGSESTSPDRQEDEEKGDFVVVAKVPFQLGGSSNTQLQAVSKEPAEGAAADSIATPEHQPHHGDATQQPTAADAESDNVSSEQQPGSPIAQPIAQAPASPPPGPVFRPSLFKSNIFKTIDK